MNSGLAISFGQDLNAPAYVVDVATIHFDQDQIHM